MKRISAFFIICAIVLSMSSFSAFAGEELIFSDSFEKGMEKWIFWDKNSKETTKISGEAYSEGENSYYFYDNSDTTSVGIKSNFIDITQGETYTAYADIYCISGTVSMYFKFYDASSKQILSKSGKGTKGEWTAVKITEVAPEGAVKCQINLCGNNASLGEGFFDNIRIYKGDVLKSISSDTKAPKGSLAPKEEIIDPYSEGDVIINESFEGDVFSSWKKSGVAFVEIRENYAKDGLKSVYVNDDSDETSGGITSKGYPASAGVTYSVVADVLNETGQISIYIKFFNVAGEAVGSTSKSITAPEMWNTLILNAKAPENTATVQVWIYTSNAAKRAGYVDNLKLIKGETKEVVPETPYIAPIQPAPVDATIVAPVDNKLSYSSFTDKGDIIGDFSYGGFYAGEYELPVTENLPVALTVSPSGTDDDTKMLQDAIDKVYNESTDEKMKALKLKSGTYYINQKGIDLRSGIILSGEGQGPTGTILYAKDPVNHFVVRIYGSAPEKVGSNAYITDEYVPAGSKTIHLSEADIKNFNVGDLITIYHPANEAWSDAIGMKGITNLYGTDTTWAEGKVDMSTERTITAINGTTITLDFGLFVPLYTSLSKVYIYKTDDSKRIHDAGVENLRVVSYYNGDPADENHATVAIAITDAKNIFVRNVSAKYFYSSIVASRSHAKQVTVLNCSNLQPVSKITGSRRYSFAASTSSQQLLYTGCYSYDGRHDFEASNPVTGPIAYVDNLIDKSNTASETHGTWSTGILFDNLYQVGNGTQGFFALANRGIYGTSISQGWSTASSVMWNCLSSTIISHKPPLDYQNFVVGSWGLYNDKSSLKMKEVNIKDYKGIYKTSVQNEASDDNFKTKEGSPFVGDSYVENEYTPVEPRSLYKAQLAQRFTSDIRNARPNAPILVYPRSDKETDEKHVAVSGVYQMGAEAVTIYIDNKAYNANLNNSDNSFLFEIKLEEGVHKISATQTINSIEGCKTADRFITIGKPNGNPDYLQSIYSPDESRMIINDPRLTFDQVEYGASDKITVTVNGSVLKSDVLPFIENGRTLVPMRAIFEAIGASVEWNAETETATSSKNSTTVSITKNQTTAYLNGSPVILDVPAAIYDGRFMVPVRFISESFGAKVEWIDKTKTVVITTLN